MSPRVRAALAWAAVGAVLAGYVVALFFPLVAHVVHGGAARWLEGDVAEEYWPDLVVLCRGLAHGTVARWTPLEHGGVPFFADPQAGVYNPLNRALCAVAGPAPSIHWADARVVAYFWLASLAMAVFLRGEGFGWGAALVGAVLFPLTPFMRHNWELNLTWGFAWLPLVLHATRRATALPSPAAGAWLGVTAALMTLVGSPPAVYFALLVAAPFGAHCALGALRGGASRAGLAAAVATAGGVYLTLALPMLVPAHELSRWSVQSAHTFARIAAEGRPLRDAAGLVLPAMTDHHYVGLATLALGAWAFAGGTAWRPRRLFLAVGVFGFAMTFGAHTPLFAVAFRVIPGVAAFRNPTRYAALFGTCAAVLAAAGVDAALAEATSPTWRRRWALGCGALSAACGAVHLAPRLDPWTHGAGVGRAGLVLAAVAVVVVVVRRTATAVPALAVLLALDLWPLLPPARHTRAGPFPERSATTATVRALLATHAESAVYDEFAVGFRSGSRQAWRDLRGYQDPMELSRYQKLAGELARTPALLATFGVRWVLWGAHQPGDEGHHYLPDPALGTWARPVAPVAYEGTQEGVYEVQHALPAAWWMDGAEVVADADAALERIRQVAPAARVVLEGGGAVGEGSGRYRPASARFDDDRVTVDLEAPDDGWLVVNQAYYPGWRAWVDGTSVPIRRANSFVRAVRVPRGRHRVVMAFAPWAPRVLEPLAALTWLGVALLGLFRGRRRGAVT